MAQQGTFQPLAGHRFDRLKREYLPRRILPEYRLRAVCNQEVRSGGRGVGSISGYTQGWGSSRRLDLFVNGRQIKTTTRLP